MTKVALTELVASIGRFRCWRAIAAVALSLAACRSDAIVSVAIGESNRTIMVTLGQELDITLGTVGPGEYASPPTISSPALRFLDVSYVGPIVPAGPRQLFRFKTVERGTAIVVFQHTGMGQAVADTVIVR